MKKHKAAIKKQELVDRLATMLKKSVLSKKEYVSITHLILNLCCFPFMQDAKKDNLNNNTHMIEEAIDNPEELKKIEVNLGIIS